MSGARFEFDGTIEENKGQQFVNGRGRHSQGFTRLHRPESHGFASQPIAGAKGLLLFPNSQSDEGYVLGGEHPGKRPTGLPAGATAIYDANGNIIKLVGDGIVADVGSNSFVFRAGGVTITISPAGLAIEGGTVTHNGTDIGDTHRHGGVESGSSSTGAPV